jgi:hypothetical protein
MKSITRLTTTALLATVLGFQAEANASRQPTLQEREGITNALPSWFKKYPVGCIWLETIVSNNSRYGETGPVFLNALHEPCLKYASNGFWILKKVGAQWKIVFNGSDAPPCSLGIPKDIAKICTHG